MHIAIIDDSKSDRTILNNYIQKFLLDKHLKFSLNIDIYENSEEFLNSGCCLNYDIIFLDIIMNKLNGIETAKILRAQHSTSKIIFTSSSSDFAVESYDVNATYYLLKPIEYTKFYSSVESIISQRTFDSRKITLPNNKNVLLCDILYIDCFNHIVNFHLNDTSTVKIRMNFSCISSSLLCHGDFVECNRGLIVNLNKILTFKNNVITLSNSKEIIVSRRKSKIVRNKLDDFLFQKTRG